MIVVVIVIVIIVINIIIITLLLVIIITISTFLALCKDPTPSNGPLFASLSIVHILIIVTIVICLLLLYYYCCYFCCCLTPFSGPFPYHIFYGTERGPKIPFGKGAKNTLYFDHIFGPLLALSAVLVLSDEK